MKGTKLWQDARSPLISGRSKRERPFWRQVLGAWAIAVIAVAGVAFLAASSDKGGTVSGIPTAFWALLGGSAFAVFPALIGAMTGVWLARKMGWAKPVVSGTALGVLFGMVWLALSALQLGRA